MMARCYLGLDLHPRRLAAVALRRRRRGLHQLTAGRVADLPDGVLALSARTPNILDRSRFVAALHEVLHPLAAGEERLAVALPDAAGRVLLTDVDAPFASRREGEEILRWQLRGSLPNEGQGVRLDYQELGRSEAGKVRLAVAAIAGSVLDQYEEVLQAAGYHATVIDFHSLQLYNYYRPQLDLGSDTLLIALEGGILSLQYFEKRQLAFHRQREIAPEIGAVFRELNRTLTGAVETVPGLRRAAVFVHHDWPVREELAEALQALFEQETIWLDPHLERICAGRIELPPWQARGLVAAIGAAERLI